MTQMSASANQDYILCLAHGAMMRKWTDLRRTLRKDVCLAKQEIKAYLRSQGKLIDDFDLLIGSTAIANNMIAVTEDVKHLGMIPRIKIENWIDRTL